MGKLVKVLILVVATFGAMLHSTEGEDFAVGDSTGWINNPPGGASFYSNWANNFTFKVNDTLVFNFATGRHVVAILSQANFEECNFTNPIEVLSTGPARVSLNRTGQFYFGCAFTGHCNSGQKLTLNVTASSLSPSPSPAPSPSTSPPCQQPFL